MEDGSSTLNVSCLVEKCFQSGKYDLIEKKSYPFLRYVINVRVLFILHIKIQIFFIYLRLNILLSMRLVVYHAWDTTTGDYKNSLELGVYSK